MKKFLVSLLLLAASVSMASATRTLDGQQITNGAAVLTLPTSTTNIVGDSTTNTLTNKTISGASNTISNISGSSISSGTVAIANGGTGQTSANAAFNALAPSQTGNSGKYLTTDGSNSSWATVPSNAPGLSGTRASPTAVTAAGGVVFSGSAYENYYFLQGSGGAVTITANPQISAGSLVGQRMVLIGRSATNTITLADGNGLSLNGSIVLGLDSTITVVWDGVNWLEVNRR